MKAITLWLSGLTALLLFSCTKDFNELSAVPDYSTSSRFNPNSQKPEAGLDAQFSDATPKAGETVNLNINTAATCGKVSVELAVDANGDPTSIQNAVDWEPLESNIPVNGSTLTVAYTTSIEGSFGFRVHYIASGGRGGPCDYSNEFEELELTVLPACQGPALTGELVSSLDKGNNTFEFTVTYTVEACTNTYTEGKLQGGLTAFVGAPLLSSSNSATTETRDLNHNYVVIFNNDQVTGSNTYTIVFTKVITGAPGTNQLTGEWSFSAKDADGNPIRLEFGKLYY